VPGPIRLKTTDLKRIPIVDITKMPKALKLNLLNKFNIICNRRIEKYYNELLKDDRKKIDKLIFRFLNITSEEEKQVYDLTFNLMQQRLEKEKSV
jgi:ATP phosphoribosyltransferase